MPVKNCVKYLDIHVCRKQQQLNLSPKLKKTKTILILWLQRDLSISGRFF